MMIQTLDMHTLTTEPKNSNSPSPHQLDDDISVLDDLPEQAIMCKGMRFVDCPSVKTVSSSSSSSFKSINTHNTSLLAQVRYPYYAGSIGDGRRPASVSPPQSPSTVPRVVAMDKCKGCDRDLTQVSKQSRDPTLEETNKKCAVCHRPRYAAKTSIPLSPPPPPFPVEDSSSLTCSASVLTAVVEEDILTSLVQNQEWDRVLDRLRDSPDEARREGGQGNGRYPLYWACYHGAPCSVLHELAVASPESIWKTTGQFQLQSVVDLVTSRGRLDAVQTLLQVSCEGDLTVALDLAYQNVAVRIQRALFNPSSPACVFKGDVQTKWDLFCFLYKAAYYKSFKAATEKPLLHALVALSCPESALQLACRLYPEQLLVADEQGNLPLHVAFLSRRAASPASSPTASTSQGSPTLVSPSLRYRRLLSRGKSSLTPWSSSAVTILVQASPGAAGLTNHEGALPLHLALRFESLLDSVLSEQSLQALVEAYPKAAYVADPMTPFQLPMETGDIAVSSVLVRALSGSLGKDDHHHHHTDGDVSPTESPSPSFVRQYSLTWMLAVTSFLVVSTLPLTKKAT